MSYYIPGSYEYKNLKKDLLDKAWERKNQEREYQIAQAYNHGVPDWAIRQQFGGYEQRLLDAHDVSEVGQEAFRRILSDQNQTLIGLQYDFQNRQLRIQEKVLESTKRQEELQNEQFNLQKRFEKERQDKEEQLNTKERNQKAAVEHIMVAERQIQEGAYPAALETYEKALNLIDNDASSLQAKIHFQKALVLMKLDRFFLAITSATACICIAPTDYHAYNLLGLAQLRNLNFSKAIEAFEESDRLKPGDRLTKARLFLSKKEYKNAKDTFVEILNRYQRNPNEQPPPELLLEIFEMTAICSFQLSQAVQTQQEKMDLLKESKDALLIARQFVNPNLENPIQLNRIETFLGLCFLEEGDKVNAKNFFLNAQKQNPQNILFHLAEENYEEHLPAIALCFHELVSSILLGYEKGLLYLNRVAEHLAEDHAAYPKIHYYLGNIYKEGLAGAKNPQLALEHFRKVADRLRGHPLDDRTVHFFSNNSPGSCFHIGNQAAFHVAEMLFAGDPPVEQNKVASLVYYRQVADAQYSEQAYAQDKTLKEKLKKETQKKVADLCYEGEQGIPKDWATAVTYYRGLSDANDNASLVKVGNMYKTGGHGLEKNIDLAIEFLRKAYDNGKREDELTYSLALLYKDKNEWKKAYPFFKKSNCDTSEKIALRDKAGYHYADEDDDGHEAIKLYKAYGSVDSHFRIGKTYLYGKGGVAKDRSVARYWIEKAMNDGSEEAKKLFEEEFTGCAIQ